VESIVWLLAVAALYGAIVFAVVAGGVAIRLRHPAFVGVVLAGLAAGYGIAGFANLAGGLQLLNGTLVSNGFSVST
jgi:hypothetical protein